MSKTIILLLGLLALASATDFKLEKDFFFIQANNKYHSTLWQTKTHVIAQSIEFTSPSQPVFQYLALDLTTGDATQVLTDVSSACDPGPYLFGKLIYHESAARLVYYCAKNNSLLYIDDEDYKVTEVVSVGGNTVYNETRLCVDGDFLVVIGISDYFNPTPGLNQFIRINVVTRQVTSDFGFTNVINPTKTVVAYASNKLESYVLAIEQVNTSITANIYMLVWVKNTFTVVPITDFTYNSNGTAVINHFYCYGNYIVTNTATNILMVGQLGTIAYNFTNVTWYKVHTSTENFAVELDYGMKYGSSDLYVLYFNDSITHYSISGSNLNSVAIGTAAQIMYVPGFDDKVDLIFVIDDQGPLFNVMEATTQKIVYTRPNGYENLMLTNSTYVSELYPYFYIFDINNDTLIANLSTSVALEYYHDTDSGFVFFLNRTSNISCQLIGVDLTSGKLQGGYQFSDSNVCTGVITQVEASNPASPQVVILLPNTTFFILTKNNGVLKFDSPPPKDNGEVNVVFYIVVDFSNLNMEFIGSPDYKVYTVEMYTFDSSSNSFVSGLAYGITSPSPVPLFNIYTVGSSQIIGVSYQSFAYLNVSATQPVLFNTTEKRGQMSMFHDGDGNTYMVFTENPAYGTVNPNNPPYLFDFTYLVQLPQSSAATTQAGAAGFCSYWMVDGLVASVGVVKFYKGCDSREMIYY